MAMLAGFRTTGHWVAAFLSAVWLAAFSLAAGAAGEGERRTFSEAEIAKNVQDYLAVVFGNSPPRLNDYLRLEGSQNRSEYHLELAECEKTWGVSIYLKCGEAQMDKRCEKWISRRSDRPAKAESLYFQSLRKVVPTAPAGIEIQEVRKDGDAYTVQARSAAGAALEFSHALDRTGANSGLVSLTAVNGQPIEELLQLPQ